MRPYERLLNYVTYDTASDGNSETCPSTEKQRVFACVLEQEMRSLGLENVRLDGNGYLYGTVPGNIPGYSGTVLGFIAHMDVVNDVPSAGVKARVVEHYDGGDIVLNGSGAVLSPKEFPELLRCRGKSLVVTDGTTLLGADDKAGIAEILTLAEWLRDHPDFKHGPVQVAFTPDEEIGRGADLFDVSGFGADFAYTLDGGAYGELEYENFNAASLKVDIAGKNIHPGSAKGRMKNAMTIGMEFERLLPPEQKPEFTEGYEGFFHLTEMSGDVEHCSMRYILRDHDARKLADKGIDVEVVDLRSIKPLDHEGILASVRKTGRALCLQEAWLTCSVMSEVTSVIAENAIDALKKPPMRLGAKECPNPYSAALERHMLPSVESIMEAVEKLMQ